MKTLLCVAVLGLALGACSYKSETVVQKPAPVPATATVVTTTDPAPAAVIVPAR